MQLMFIVCVYGYDINLIGGYDKENIVEIFGLDKECYVLVMFFFIGKVVDEGYVFYCLLIDKIVEWK